jgi:glutamate carboxypeptidase
VSARKGSGNFTAVMRGRGGHAGRDAAAGRNALHALAEFTVSMNAFAAEHPGITVNLGRVDGGGPVNRIPDFGAARFNVRVETGEQMRETEKFLEAQAAAWNSREGYALEFQGGFASPPKPVEGGTKHMLEAVLQCGKELGLDLGAASSGGACDGNKLAALGLPNLDSLGPVGGNLHGGDEWMQIASLAERAQLTALLLMKFAAGEIAWLACGHPTK